MCIPFLYKLDFPYCHYRISWTKQKFPLGFIKKAAFNQNCYYETIITTVKRKRRSLPSVSRIGQAGYALPQLVVEGYGEAFVYNKNDYFNEFQEVIRDKNEFIECTLLTPQGYYTPTKPLGTPSVHHQHCLDVILLIFNHCG